MHRRAWTWVIAGLVLIVGLAASGAAPASSGGIAACAATPLMNNVPRGSEAAVEWQLCVLTDGHGRWRAMTRICGAGARTTSCAGQRCHERVLGRLHTELSLNGTRHALADTREVLEPSTCTRSATIATGWHSHRGGGWYCATLWNHDALGYYAVVPGEVSLGGDRAADAVRVPAPRASAARPRAASKWKSVCLSP